MQQRLLHLAGTFGAGSQRAKALEELHGFRQGRLGVADFNVQWLNLAVEAGVHIQLRQHPEPLRGGSEPGVRAQCSCTMVTTADIRPTPE